MAHFTVTVEADTDPAFSDPWELDLRVAVGLYTEAREGEKVTAFGGRSRMSREQRATLQLTLIQPTVLSSDWCHAHYLRFMQMLRAKRYYRITESDLPRVGGHFETDGTPTGPYSLWSDEDDSILPWEFEVVEISYAANAKEGKSSWTMTFAAVDLLGVG